MKTLIFFSILFFSNFVFGQVAPQEASVITYKREIPNTNTYKVMKNTTGMDISDKVLEEINLHRRFDQDYLWKVSNKIEILIYVVGKTE